MRRLKSELLERTKKFGHRMVDVAEAIEQTKKSSRVTGRIIDQVVGCGTSVGANFREADEALSRADFCKCLGIALKELGESRYWIEFVAERSWVQSGRLDQLANEATELVKLTNTLISRTRRSDSTAGRAVPGNNPSV